MRVIKSDTGFLYYEKIFKQLIANQCEVVLWQVSPASGERQISNTRISAFHRESQRIYFEAEGEVNLLTSLPLYCYVEAGPLIFKATVQDLSSGVCIGFPEEIKLLEEPDVVLVRGSSGASISDVWRTKRLDTSPVELEPDFMRVKSMSERSTRDQELLNNEFGLSVDEEDKLFADKRESPRARPKDDKWVKVAKFEGDGPQIFKLFDLSRGGMGFVTFDEHEFPKGSTIHIVGFNEFDLDDPLVGKVMSIRPIDGEVEFKVGVKFSEGQD